MSALTDCLIRHFETGIKDGESGCLGVEIEHFLLKKETKEALPYAGPAGVREVIRRLMFLWPDSVPLPGEDLFGFTVRDFAITLEPAAQMEISIAPEASIARISGIYRDFRQKLDEILSELGAEACTAGCHPVSRVENLVLIPKERYRLMNRHFAQTGTGGKEMMRGTASVQISIDYRSEEDFRRKLQAAYYFAPLFKLLCDNSASFEGRPLTGHLKRTDIWNRVDPARCGILPDVFAPDYGFRHYAEFLAAMPLIFLDGEEKVPTGFRTTAEIYAGRVPDEAEILHITSMAFPDVRLKKILEIRPADSMPQPFMSAYSALVKGLMYAEDVLDRVQEEIRMGNLTEDDIRAAEESLTRDGWDGQVYGRPVRQMAEELLAAAGRFLPEEEQGYLEPFFRVIRYGGILNLPGEEAGEGGKA